MSRRLRAFLVAAALYLASIASVSSANEVNDPNSNHRTHEITTSLEMSVDGTPAESTDGAPPSLVFGNSHDSTAKGVESAVEIRKLRAEVAELYSQKNASDAKIAELSRRVTAAKQEAEVRMNSQRTIAEKLAKLDTEYKEFKEEHMKIKKEWFQLKYESPERKVSEDEKELQQLREEHEKAVRELKDVRQKLQATKTSSTVLERKRCKEAIAELEQVKKELSLKGGKN
jgi:chromosome segregation ATPase